MLDVLHKNSSPFYYTYDHDTIPFFYRSCEVWTKKDQPNVWSCNLSRSKCGDSGTQCKSSSRIEHCSYQIQCKDPDRDSVSISCTSGFVLGDSTSKRVLTCSGNQWNMEIPKCIKELKITEGQQNCDGVIQASTNQNLRQLYDKTDSTCVEITHPTSFKIVSSRTTEVFIKLSGQSCLQTSHKIQVFPVLEFQSHEQIQPLCVMHIYAHSSNSSLCHFSCKVGNAVKIYVFPENVITICEVSFS